MTTAPKFARIALVAMAATLTVGIAEAIEIIDHNDASALSRMIQRECGGDVRNRVEPPRRQHAHPQPNVARPRPRGFFSVLRHDVQQQEGGECDAAGRSHVFRCRGR